MDQTSLLFGLKQRLRWAQNKLDSDYKDKMMRIARRMLPDEAAAEDAVSRGFRKFHEQVECLTKDGPASIASYLYHCVCQQCLEIIRREKRYRHHLRMMALERGESEPDDNLFRRDVQSVLVLLDPELRIVTVLFMNGCSHAQIGWILSIPEGTSKTRFKKAKEILKPLFIQKGINNANG